MLFFIIVKYIIHAYEIYCMTVLEITILLVTIFGLHITTTVIITLLFCEIKQSAVVLDSPSIYIEIVDMMPTKNNQHKRQENIYVIIENHRKKNHNIYEGKILEVFADHEFFRTNSAH